MFVIEIPIRSMFCMFSKFVNFIPIDLKIGTRIDWTYTMYLAKQYIDQNNILIYVSMATKYPIIKHRVFFKTLTFSISANNEDISQKFLLDTCDHTLLYLINWARYIFHSFFMDTSRDTLSDKRPLGLITPPLIINFLATENWRKVKSGQVGVGSNNAENHSSSL